MDVTTTKKIAYTLDATLKVVQDSDSDLQPDVVILHSLTNDIKSISPANCVDKVGQVVDAIQEKWERAKCIISLTTPRMDDKTHRINCEILDGMIKQRYLDNRDVYISDNSNMWHGSTPAAQLLDIDKFHLNEKGCAILASNIKSALHTVLGIRRRRSPIRYSRGRGGRNYGRPGRGRRGGHN